MRFLTTNTGVVFLAGALLGGSYLDRADWWAVIDRPPLHRIAVSQDLDRDPGSSASVGVVNAAILKAIHCASAITNGAVRDLPAVSWLEFPMFAPFVAVSHSYMHLVDYGEPVEILALAVRAGDLLYADCHGVISIPLEIAAEFPDVAAPIRSKEQRIAQICFRSGYSTERLWNAIRSDQR